LCVVLKLFGSTTVIHCYGQQDEASEKKKETMESVRSASMRLCIQVMGLIVTRSLEADSSGYILLIME